MDKLKKIRSILAITFVFLGMNLLFSQSDIKPQPYGGNQLMRDFICDEMIYPPSALETNTEGTVEVAFTIMHDGKKTNYHIVNSVSPELDQEALRICQLIMFHPAIKLSKYIIDDVVVPVKFNIKKYKRNCKKKGFDKFNAYSGPTDTSLNVYPTKYLDISPKPIFENPNMNFATYIVDNLRYPDAAFKENISGTVELNFIVETSGRISNIEIAQPLGGGCSEEAIQLLKSIHWNPGIKNGMAVRSFLTVNISFSLNNDGGHQYLPNNSSGQM